MDIVAIVLALVVVVGVVAYLFSTRKQKMKAAEAQTGTAAGLGLSTSRDLFEAETGHRAPVAEFHVKGDEAIVTFDVPLPEDEDEVLHDLLVDEAVEVVREKRHTLPIADVEVIVAFAGRGEVREVGRTKLPSAGELPPPLAPTGLGLGKVARDPFASPFEDGADDHSVLYETKVDVPGDRLPPLSKEVRLPQGLERGLRAAGYDPDETEGPQFVLTLLRMFGYQVTEHSAPGSYVALKDGVSTYILTDAYEEGDHPELGDPVIRRFLADFGSSGADRGMLISDKYSPFSIYEIERHQPKIRFITRERIQRFIDSMALG
ncbi:MAG: hypothetical protein R3258_03205 [Acidimicrobiia bacterium]|nr:hypothetical protein [Acidimicrobiia bacterium]